MFKRIIILSTAVSGALTAIAVAAYSLYPVGLLETLGITFGTCFYHFAMRMFVGAAYSPLQYRIDYRAAWFQPKAFENALYKALRVRKWKDRLPTYDPASFDIQTHSLEELAQVMCHSELVHETIAVLSFLPLFAAIPFGAFPVFLITSLLAAVFDMLFVILQRYNRPRLIRLMKRKK